MKDQVDSYTLQEIKFERRYAMLAKHLKRAEILIVKLKTRSLSLNIIAIEVNKIANLVVQHKLFPLVYIFLYSGLSQSNIVLYILLNAFYLLCELISFSSLNILARVSRFLSLRNYIETYSSVVTFIYKEWANYNYRKQ